MRVLLALIEKSFSALAGVIRIKRLLRKWSVSLDPRLQPECLRSLKGFPGGASGKEPAYQCSRVRDSGSTPGLGRSPGGGHGNPLQYFCLENPMDRGAWQATVHRVAKSRTRLK